jgi:hypothetical protein
MFIWLILITGLLLGLPGGAVIDVNREQMVTLSQLARRLPRRRMERPVHPATIHRWRCPGVRGIRLECVRIGGIWHTSLEAYQRWVDRLNALETYKASAVDGPLHSVSEEQHQHDIEAALDQLDS